jgi:hypothetical protein
MQHELITSVKHTKYTFCNTNIIITIITTISFTKNMLEFAVAKHFIVVGMS